VDSWGILVAAADGLCDANYNQVVGNIVSANQGTGIVLRGASNQTLSHNLVANNLCYDNIAPVAFSNADGIYVDSVGGAAICWGNLISGNICRGNQRTGIIVDRPTPPGVLAETTLIGNICQGNAEGIHIYAGVTDSVAIGNSCVANTVADWTDAGTATYKLMNRIGSGAMTPYLDTPGLQVDTNAVADNVMMLVNRVGTGLVRVSVGIADSGGAGYRLLRVPN